MTRRPQRDEPAPVPTGRPALPSLPVLLGWFADSADPDAGLLGFRKISDALGKSPWYLRLLRDEGAAAENLARVLSAGRFAPDLLLLVQQVLAPGVLDRVLQAPDVVPQPAQQGLPVVQLDGQAPDIAGQR